MIEAPINPIFKKSKSKCKSKLKNFKAKNKALKKELDMVNAAHKKNFEYLEKMFNLALQIKEVRPAPVIDAKILSKRKKSKKKKEKKH